MFEIAKKSEKLASAIYLITGFFDDREPVKWKLRELVSELVSLGIFINDGIHKDKETAVIRLRGLVLEIISFLSMTKNAGLVSDLNFSILNQELQKYIDLLSLPTGLVHEGQSINLSENYFELEAKWDKKLSAPETVIRDKQVDRRLESSRLILPETINELDKGQDLRKFSTVSVKKNSRQSVIISVLKRKKEVMIKDISPLISGCSEKTIQRELLAMVEAGILKKTGEKRWSRYSLA